MSKVLKSDENEVLTKQFQNHSRYMCFQKIMLNFKIRICDRFFAIKFSSKWRKMEKSQQVRVFFKNHASKLSKPSKSSRQSKSSKSSKASKSSKSSKPSKPSKAKRASLAKQTKQAKQSKQSKQTKPASQPTH